jgi:hypothetical protein
MSAVPVRNQTAMLCRTGCVLYARLSCLIVGGEVAQPRRTMHTVMPRSMVIPCSHADVYKVDP